MSVTEAGDGWDVTVEDGVMVWEFRPGMELAAFADDAYPVFERLLESHDITAMVTAVDLDDPFSEAVFEIWEESAERAEKAGVERWGVAADGIKAISLRGKVNTDDLETFTTEDRDEAVEWAQSS